MNSAVEYYKTVFEDLKARRVALDAARTRLDAAIAAIEGLIGDLNAGGALAAAVDTSPSTLFSESSQPTTQRPYANMTIADATIDFLRATKRPQKTAAIADALRRGGIRSEAKGQRLQSAGLKIGRLHYALIQTAWYR